MNLQTVEGLLRSIHPNPLFGLAAVLGGFIVGVALACTDWRSNFTLGKFALSAIASITAERFEIVRKAFQSSALLTAVLLALNVALVTFFVSASLAVILVFVVNYVASKRQGDPEALFKAGRRAYCIFVQGLQSYVTASPDLLARNKIAELTNFNETLRRFSTAMASEIATPGGSHRHFMDVMESAGRQLLKNTFGDGADLREFRLAFFVRDKGRLEYSLTINNGEPWSAHSGQGFVEANSFMSVALQKDRPFVYPRDKKRRNSFEERKGSRYKSFAVMPVPCGKGREHHIGAITIDYTGDAGVFTSERMRMIFEFSQLLYVFYRLNVSQLQAETRLLPQPAPVATA